MKGHIAVAETEIDASPDEVFGALTDAAKIREYMFGTEVVTDWKRGSTIVWKGEFDGKEYADRGEILGIEPPHHLTVTHFSASSGREDAPENYHTIHYELRGIGEKTRVKLSQDNNRSEDEAERSTTNWKKVLSGLKDVVERS